MDDPHPIPWVRVKLSSAIGQALYPHPQWNRLARLWESLYPPAGLDEERQRLLSLLERAMPEFVEILVNHRPPSLRGGSLKQILAEEERRPARLADYYRAWRSRPSLMRRAPPSLVFAVMGQARIDETVSPEEESRVIAGMLTYWALRSTLDISSICAGRVAAKPRPPSINDRISQTTLQQGG